MRTLSPDIARLLGQDFGVETSVLVKVYWSESDSKYYADKGNSAENVEGRILELSPLESVISLDISSASSISVKFDDSDSYFRDKYNNVDIHKIKADVFLWNPKLPTHTATLLFSGFLNTPFIWSEGERTFGCSIVSQLESYEIGYSIDMGYSRWVPQNMYGRPFPMVFGMVSSYPLMMLTESPHMIIKRGIGFAFEDGWDSEIADLLVQATDLFNKSRDAFLEAEATAAAASGYNDGDSTFTPPDDFGTYQSLMQAANELFRQSGVYAAERLNVLYKISQLEQEKDELVGLYGPSGSQTVPFYSENLYIPAAGLTEDEDPNGVLQTAFTATYEAGNEQFVATVVDQSITNIRHVQTRNIKKPKPFFQNITQGEVVKRTTSNDTGATQKFIWIDGGTTIRVVSLPITYVVGVGNCTVHRVYSRKNGVPVTVPSSLYTMTQITVRNPDGNQIGVVTCIQTSGLLSALRDSQGEKLYDSDEVWADVTGPVSGNFTDIVGHIVSTYTDLTLSSDFVTNCTPANLYPMGFVYESNEDALTFLKKLSYQARVSLWITNGVVKGRYLPSVPIPVMTLTPDHVLEKTLELGCTSTDQIVTKYIAEWRPDANKGEVNRYVIRHNLKKYGLSEQTYNFFAYTAPGAVEKIATYWAVQHATVYKTVSFQCPLEVISLEAQDAVELSGFENIIGCTDTVIGIVQGSVYNSADQTIEVVVKLPIRLGETCPYDFAYPAETLRLYRNDQAVEYETGNPFEQSRNDFFNVANSFLFVSRGPSPPAWSGNPTDISDNFNDSDSPIKPPLTTTVRPGIPTFDTVRPTFIDQVNETSKYEVVAIARPTIPTANRSSDVKMGIVIGLLEGTVYNVQFLGAVDIVPVTQVLINPDYQVPEGTPVICVKQGDGYVMQSPVWARRA